MHSLWCGTLWCAVGLCIHGLCCAVWSRQYPVRYLLPIVDTFDAVLAPAPRPESTTSTCSSSLCHAADGREVSRNAPNATELGRLDATPSCSPRIHPAPASSGLSNRDDHVEHLSAPLAPQSPEPTALVAVGLENDRAWGARVANRIRAKEGGDDCMQAGRKVTRIRSFGNPSGAGAGAASVG